MNTIQRILNWLKATFAQMSFYMLLVYLFLAFWVVFIDAVITNSFLDYPIKLFFELSGVYAVIELLKRLFPNIQWEGKKD